MTTVVQTTYPQPSGYPPQQQQGYPQSGYPQPGYPSSQPAVIHMPPPQTTTATSIPGRSEKYNKTAGLVTGILQICAGGLLVLLGVVLLSLGTHYNSGWNIWGGICFYVVTGILGVVSRNQNKCVIVAYMVMCIITAVSAAGQLIYDSAGANFASWFYCWSWNYYNICSHATAIVALHSLAAITGFAEMIVAIVASCYCCCGVCGGSTPTQTTVVTYGQAAPAGQVTVVAPGGYPGYPQGQYPMMVQGQPPAYTQPQQQQQPQWQGQQPPLQPQAPQQPDAYQEPK